MSLFVMFDWVLVGSVEFRYVVFILSVSSCFIWFCINEINGDIMMVVFCIINVGIW